MYAGGASCSYAGGVSCGVCSDASDSVYDGGLSVGESVALASTSAEVATGAAVSVGGLSVARDGGAGAAVWFAAVWEGALFWSGAVF